MSTHGNAPQGGGGRVTKQTKAQRSKSIRQTRALDHAAWNPDSDLSWQCRVVAMGIHLVVITGDRAVWDADEFPVWIAALMKCVESVRFAFRVNIRTDWALSERRPRRSEIALCAEVVSSPDLDASDVLRAFKMLVDDGWLERTDTPFVGAQSSIDGYYVCRLPLQEVEE